MWMTLNYLGHSHQRLAPGLACLRILVAAIWRIDIKLDPHGDREHVPQPGPRSHIRGGTTGSLGCAQCAPQVLPKWLAGVATAVLRWSVGGITNEPSRCNAAVEIVWVLERSSATYGLTLAQGEGELAAAGCWLVAPLWMSLAYLHTDARGSLRWSVNVRGCLWMCLENRPGRFGRRGPRRERGRSLRGQPVARPRRHGNPSQAERARLGILGLNNGDVLLGCLWKGEIEEVVARCLNAPRDGTSRDRRLRHSRKQTESGDQTWSPPRLSLTNPRHPKQTRCPQLVCLTLVLPTLTLAPTF